MKHALSESFSAAAFVARLWTKWPAGWRVGQKYGPQGPVTARLHAGEPPVTD